MFNPLIMKKITCRIAEVSLMSDDILKIDIRAKENFSEQDFIELKEAAKEIGQGRRFYNLIHVGDHTIPDREARIASCSIEGARYKLADAFVINTLGQKVIANLMLRINKPIVPTRFFCSIEKASAWLKELKTADEMALV